MRTPPIAALLLVPALALVACSSDSPADTSDAGGWASVHCTNSSSSGSGGDCKRSYSGCSDGHSYGIECAGGSCTCRIDTASTGQGTTFTCGSGDLPGLAQNCDWHQH
jgi:hypothetical protein